MSAGDAKREAPLLDWPDEWGRERLPGRLIAALLILVSIVLISVPYTLSYIEKDEPLRSALGVLGGLVCFSMLLAFVPRLKVRRKYIAPSLKIRRIPEQGPGLRADVHSSWRPLLFAWLVLGAAFLVFRGILFASDLDEAAGSARRGMDAGGLILVVLVFAMIVLLALYLFAGRSRRYFLAMSEYGISQALGRTVRTLRWNDVAAVQPILLNNNHTVRITPVPGSKVHVDTGRSLIDRMQRGLLEGAIDVPVGTLGIDPALMLHVIRFYWLHPRSRHELTSESVIDRMRRGDLPG
ncbi:hypothetical protein [Nocardia blacklockiae]|uniref:hypothetical protein n=1 Tax=Nocardia blacklockiae TaxID=480036 RepID=UPI0018936727|nr:hypothetical protein [Nocardia blacklockiae]MBF6174923.1 hypothetical protein [Nocardia blacklockiae]